MIETGLVWVDARLRDGRDFEDAMAFLAGLGERRAASWPGEFMDQQIRGGRVLP